MEQPPLIDIIRSAATTARRAWEPIWPLWKAASGYPGPIYPASRDACIPTAFALLAVFRQIAPELRWRVTGGKPTKRTPRGGFVDPTGTPRPHLWIEGRAIGRVVVVDVTADQFGGPSVIVEDGGSPAHTANATPKLLEFYGQHERETVALLVSAFDAAIREGKAA